MSNLPTFQIIVCKHTSNNSRDTPRALGHIHSRYRNATLDVTQDKTFAFTTNALAAHMTAAVRSKQQAVMKPSILSWKKYSGVVTPMILAQSRLEHALWDWYTKRFHHTYLKKGWWYRITV
jgi:hypothetical protein